MYVVMAPIVIIINNKAQEAMNPIMMPEVLLPSCSDKARVGMSPSLLGVAIPPTCPRRVAEIVSLMEIFSM